MFRIGTAIADNRRQKRERQVQSYPALHRTDACGARSRGVVYRAATLPLPPSLPLFFRCVRQAASPTASPAANRTLWMPLFSRSSVFSLMGRTAYVPTIFCWQQILELVDTHLGQADHDAMNIPEEALTAAGSMPMSHQQRRGARVHMSLCKD